MKQIIDGQIIEGMNGEHYFRMTPGSGTIYIYGKLPDGSFDTTPTYSYDQNTDKKLLRFYLPMIPGEGWKFEITGNAVAEYH